MTDSYTIKYLKWLSLSIVIHRFAENKGWLSWLTPVLVLATFYGLRCSLNKEYRKSHLVLVVWVCGCYLKTWCHALIRRRRGCQSKLKRQKNEWAVASRVYSDIANFVFSLCHMLNSFNFWLMRYPFSSFRLKGISVILSRVLWPVCNWLR